MAIDLGECRTGYVDDTFSHILSYETDAIPPITETVVDSFVTTNDEDSGTTLVDNGDHTYTYSGNFTISSFSNITMKFREFENLTDITLTGWPPSDDRAKDMHLFNLDPRDARTYEIVITYKVRGFESGIPITDAPYIYDSDYGFNVRTITRTYLKDAVNRTGEQFASILRDYFNGA